MVDAVAEGRTGTEAQARTLIDEGPYTAEGAFKSGLVDAVIYPDGIDQAMKELVSKKFELKEDYRKTPSVDGWRSPRQIAVVFVTGLITAGESAAPGLFGGGSTGSDTIVRAIAQAREKDSVAALVLRVDSPGGSAFASDAIWRAVKRFQATDRPVIVSMGGTAASGGYYVAAGADKIYAEATTVTGSIGVYGGKLSLASLYDKVGIDVTLLSRGRNAAMFSTAKPFDPVEGAAMDRLIGDTYKQFKARVAAGRKLSDEEVEKIAQGRVWTGSRAQKIGLVDEIGGFFEAIDAAKSLADLGTKRHVDLVTFSGQQTNASEAPMRNLRGLVPEFSKLVSDVEALQVLHTLESEHTLLLLPFRLELQ
jgi:protease-4